MSLLEQVANHEVMETIHAVRAVRALQCGDPVASMHLEAAAEHRHLAYELRDTDRIAWAARQAMHLAR